MGVFHRVFIRNGNMILEVIQLWSMFSPLITHADPNKWCFVTCIVPVLEACEHDPDSDHCS